METGTTRRMEDGPGEGILYVGFELGDLRWTLTMGAQMGRLPRQRRVHPRDRAAVLGEIEETKRRFGVVGGRTVSCYEAGREGFWLRRWLVSEGIENRVVDSATIEVSRRKVRVKADRMDGKKLLRMLMRYEAGEKGVRSVVRVPSIEAEDARHLHRELTTLKRARVQVTNRIKGLLATQGSAAPAPRGARRSVSTSRRRDGWGRGMDGGDLPGAKEEKSPGARNAPGACTGTRPPLRAGLMRRPTAACSSLPDQAL